MKEIPVEEAGGPAFLGLRFLPAALLADAALLPSRNAPSRSSSTVSVSTAQQSQWLLSEVSTPVSQYHIRSEITWLISLHDANLLPQRQLYSSADCSVTDDPSLVSMELHRDIS